MTSSKNFLKPLLSRVNTKIYCIKICLPYCHIKHLWAKQLNTIVSLFQEQVWVVLWCLSSCLPTTVLSLRTSSTTSSPLSVQVLHGVIAATSGTQSAVGSHLLMSHGQTSQFPHRRNFMSKYKVLLTEPDLTSKGRVWIQLFISTLPSLNHLYLKFTG